MLIGLDASRTTAARPTGTERYALQLIRALIGLDSPHRFRLYFRDAPNTALLPISDRVEHRRISLPRLWTHAGLSAELLRRPPNVLFVPAHVLPLIHPAPSVVTVHDLGYLRYPEAHPAAQRAYLHWSTAFSARGATRVIADSQATARDLAAYYHIPAEKIAVVYPGGGEGLAPVHDAERLRAMRAKYGLPEVYLLHVGTLQPRKNLVRLVEAFGRVLKGNEGTGSEDWRSGVGLVLAGRKGWLYEPIFRGVEALGLAGRVRFVDYVEGDDMAALYSGAQAFVFPSLYEGFGFPVLEAMACGTPVICSKASSLPEVAGEAALLVDPQDTDALAGAIERVLADEALRADLIRRGFEQARQFSWERAARETLAVVEEAAITKRSRGTEGTNLSSFSSPSSLSSLGPPRSLSLLGIPVHDLTYAETLARIEAFVAEGGPHQICTANPEFVMAAQRDPEFAAILKRADLVLPDGIGLIWASRWLAAVHHSGPALRERVAGSTLVWRLGERAAQRGWRVFFLGAGEGVAARAGEILCERWPGLIVAGTYAGSPGREEEGEIVARVAAARPDLLLVAYGAPQQDKWIARNAARLGAPLMMGVGGSLDFIAEVAVRAPGWVQRLGLEWLHRLLRQPWRWRRMLALPRFAVRVILDR